MNKQKIRTKTEIDGDLLAAYEERDRQAVIAQQAQLEFNQLNAKIAQLQNEKADSQQS